MIPNMKNTSLIVSVIALVMASVVLLISLSPAKNDSGFQVDKNNYAELVIENELEDLTELWNRRYAVDVVILTDSKEVLITLSVANGEEPLSATQVDSLKRALSASLKTTIETSEFDWLKSYTKLVQYI